MTLTAEEPLLERDAELSALRARIADAERGSGGLVLIEGEAGIGKTRLLTAAGDLARERGVTVLSARGGELERDYAYLRRALAEPPERVLRCFSSSARPRRVRTSLVREST